MRADLQFSSAEQAVERDLLRYYAAGRACARLRRTARTATRCSGYDHAGGALHAWFPRTLAGRAFGLCAGPAQPSPCS